MSWGIGIGGSGDINSDGHAVPHFHINAVQHWRTSLVRVLRANLEDKSLNTMQEDKSI